MEARNIGIALSAVAIAMFAAFVAYSLQHDALLRVQQKAAQELTAARNELQSAEERKTRSAARLDEIKASYAKDNEAANEMAGRIQSIEEDIRRKEGSLAEAAKELEAVEKQIKEAVELQRAAAVGSTYPRIDLSNGKVLLNARLVRFAPQNLEFAHSAGKTTVRWSLLPKELTDRFRMGAGEETDDTVIEDTDDAGPTEEQLAEAQAEAKAAAKAAEQRRLLHDRLKTVRYHTAVVSASIQAMSRKAAPNPAQMAELQRKLAALQATEREIMETLSGMELMR